MLERFEHLPRAPFERLALLHKRIAYAVGLPAKLDESPVMDNPVDNRGGHLAVVDLPQRNTMTE